MFSTEVCLISDNVKDNNERKKRIRFPYKIIEVEPNVNKELLESFTGERTGFVQVGPKKYFFPSGYVKEAENLYNFEVRSDDVWIITYPRSGTTLTQEMVWLLANDLDYETAAKIPLIDRVPFLEFSMFVHPSTKADFLRENGLCKIRQAQVEALSFPVYKSLEKETERRFIKTHLPFSLLPPNLLSCGCKVIYIARNPKDVAVSFYHLNRLIRTQGYIGDFPTYWNYFKNGLQPWAPYWSHVQEGWNQHNSNNVLFMRYEKIVKDLHATIKKVANFLDVELNEEQLSRLNNHLKISNFRNNASVNYDVLSKLGILNDKEESYIRKGKNGTWKDSFTPALNMEANEWIEENSKKIQFHFFQ